MRILTILFIFIIGFSACQESYFYNQSKSIDENGWDKDMVLDFPFQINTLEDNYHLYLDVTHTTEFDYQNMYVAIQTQFPDNTTSSDTLSFNLANNQGEWNGKCSGETCELRVFMANNMKFNQTGDYVISFTQFSRDKSIKHLKALSLKLDKLKI